MRTSEIARNLGLPCPIDEGALGTVGAAAPLFAPSGAVLATVCLAGYGQSVLSSALAAVRTTARITSHHRRG